MARRKKTVVKSSPATGPGREAWFIVTALVLSILLFDSDARDPFLAIRMAALSAWGLAALTWLLSSRRPMAIAGRPGRLFLWLGLGYLLINLASLWKAQNVPEGLLAVARYGLHLALAYLLLILLSNPLQEMKLLSRFLTATLAACALIGIAQYYDVLPFDIPGTLPPTGLSGNRNLYGSFLVMLLPWAGFSFFQNKGLWRNLSIAALALGGFALVLSQTRSAWLATGILLATFQLLLLLRRHQLSEGLRRQWRYALLAGVMGIGAAIALAFASGSPLANSIKWRAKTFFQLPAQHAEPANEAERNAQDRLYVWKHTAEMIKAHPLLGIGAGNWRVRFPEYGGSSAPSFEGIDQMRLRPHNVYLGIASEAGLPALLLYLAMGALALGAAWRAGRRAKSESEALLAILLFSGLLAAAVDMAFSFPTERPEHNLLLLVYAALALNLAAGAGAAPKQARSTRIILAAGLVALLGFSFWMALQKRQLDRNMQEALRLETRGNFEMAARLSEQAEARFFSLDPIGDPVAWHTANAYKQMKQLDKALEKAETAERIQPNSHRVLNTKASILMGLERYEEAVPVLQKAVQLAPRYEPALTNLAYCLYRTGQNAACLETLEKLKLEENPRLLLVRSDAGYKMEMAKLENSPMYQVGLQFALEWKATGRAGISPAARALYEQRASDEAFIQEYFQTINTY
ncbi:MAG: O-antigen ligase family protein, partial [Phaeodactylibacter sp.]|nr:O-antigen ligase family protein [Phaeodactylibacter sp.]